MLSQGDENTSEAERTTVIVRLPADVNYASEKEVQIVAG